MIVSKGNNGYAIIMADSDTSEIVIKMKEEAAMELRDRLNSLLLMDVEELSMDEERRKEEKLLLSKYKKGDESYKEMIKRLANEPSKKSVYVTSKVGVCKLKSKFCEHALRKDDGTKSGHYPNNKEIGYGACGGEYCE